MALALITLKVDLRPFARANAARLPPPGVETAMFARYISPYRLLALLQEISHGN
ncbi:hypothetical protein DFAR_950023 [Desulfarculales bacterium]